MYFRLWRVKWQSWNSSCSTSPPYILTYRNIQDSTKHSFSKRYALFNLIFEYLKTFSHFWSAIRNNQEKKTKIRNSALQLNVKKIYKKIYNIFWQFLLILLCFAFSLKTTKQIHQPKVFFFYLSLISWTF